MSGDVGGCARNVRKLFTAAENDWFTFGTSS